MVIVVKRRAEKRKWKKRVPNVPAVREGIEAREKPGTYKSHITDQGDLPQPERGKKKTVPAEGMERVPHSLGTRRRELFE